VWYFDCVVMVWQENALKVISPATVDVLLQSVQTGVTLRTHDYHPVNTAAVMSVKQLVLTCLARLVHIIHSVQPEQVSCTG